MIDLNDIVPFCGTPGSRGIEGAKHLKKHKEYSGWFDHNDTRIVVHQDSTERELDYQYQAKRNVFAK